MGGQKTCFEFFPQRHPIGHVRRGGGIGGQQILESQIGVRFLPGRFVVRVLPIARRSSCTTCFDDGRRDLGPRKPAPKAA